MKRLQSRDWAAKEKKFDNANYSCPCFSFACLSRAGKKKKKCSRFLSGKVQTRTDGRRICFLFVNPFSRSLWDRTKRFAFPIGRSVGQIEANSISTGQFTINLISATTNSFWSWLSNISIFLFYMFQRILHLSGDNWLTAREKELFLVVVVSAITSKKLITVSKYSASRLGGNSSLTRRFH